MNIHIISFTKKGFSLSKRLKDLLEEEVSLSFGGKIGSEEKSPQKNELSSIYLPLSEWVKAHFQRGNALVFISINRDEMPVISQTGATGSEKFQGYRLLDKKQAEELLIRGRDENGVYYPLYTWAALMFFMGIS